MRSPSSSSLLNIFWARRALARARVAARRRLAARGERLVTPTRKRRLLLVLGIVAGVGIAGALALNAFRQNVMFFFDPRRSPRARWRPGRAFRLGGMVTQGSVQRAPGSLEVRFVVTDFKHQVPVSYTGVLPDLFREGPGSSRTAA